MPDLRKSRRKFKLLKKSLPKPPLPTRLQLEYFAELRKMLAYARALLKARLYPVLPELLDRAAQARGDSVQLTAQSHADAQSPGRRINRIMDRVSELFYKKFTHDRLEALATKVANAVSDTQRTQLLEQVRRSIGIDLKTVADTKLTGQLKQFAADNVALIKSIPQQLFDEVEKRVLTGMREGTRHTELLTELGERFGVADSRMKLIARDQVLKLNGALNGARQQALGITRYTWRTAGDERVRGTPGGISPKGTHYERDGEVYSWDDPPGDPSDPADGGHPGQAINCRCWSEPLIADLVDEG